MDVNLECGNQELTSNPRNDSATTPLKHYGLGQRRYSAYIRAYKQIEDATYAKSAAIARLHTQTSRIKRSTIEERNEKGRYYRGPMVDSLTWTQIYLLDPSIYSFRSLHRPYSRTWNQTPSCVSEIS